MIPFTVYTDASDSGLGAVLSQRVGSSEYVVCYASRSLTSAEKNYSTTEKECLAIVWAIHYWRPYLLGKAFQVVTDHQSLTWLQGLKEPKGRLARWILTLQEYDFAIVHRPGRENSNADALSRSPLPTTVVNHPHLPDEEIVIGVRPTLIETEWSLEEICQAQHDDPVVSTVLQVKLNRPAEQEAPSDWTDDSELRRYRQVWKKLEIIDGVLHRRVSTSGRKDGLVLVVPRKMRADLLRLSHNDPSSGHMGINRCVERLQPWYYWPGMTSELHLWVAECDVCNQRKPSSASHRSPMENIRVSQPMELWAMDILGPLPITAREHQYVLVTSDHFTKWIEAVPMADQKAETVARAFIDNVVSRHGVPVKLLTDQGRNFESELMKEVFKLFGVHKLRTSPYHPLTDSQVERFNRTLKAIISSYVNDHHNDWDLHLPLALFAYRTSVHSSTRIYPFKAVYGRDATTPLVLLGSTEEPKTRLIADYCAELEFTLKEIHATVAEKIKKAQTQQKQNYDYIVWLHSTVIPKGRSRKFHKLWIGPYVILRCQRRLNYLIRPKSGKGRSSCVHRNRLKLVQNQTDDINEQDMPSPLSTKSENTQERRVTEPPIVHKEVEATNMVPLRRSTRQRRPLDRYQDFNLDELEIEGRVM